jgi:hypothetical protein
MSIEFLIFLGGLLIGIIDTYIIVKERERLKRQKLEFELDNVRMHYETEAEAEYYKYKDKYDRKILNEITSFCEECGSKDSCSEDECVLFRIEKIVNKEK